MPSHKLASSRPQFTKPILAFILSGVIPYNKLMLKKGGLRFGVGIVLLSLVILPVTPVYGAIGCSASVTPHTVNPNGTVNFQVEITNTDSDTITWLRITRPSDNFTIISNSSSGWSSSTTEEYSYQSDGTLDPGQSMTIDITADIANTQAAAADWVVETTDTPGINLVPCSGSLGTEIAGSTADVTPPSIYNVSVSNLRTTSVLISWVTSEPATSQVYYGPDQGYGSSSQYDASLKTNHSVQINDLTADTAYHYQVSSKDGADNEAVSADNTFLTPLVDPTTTINTEGIRTKIPIKAVPTEKVPPTVIITTNFDKPFKFSPTITGEAIDNDALAGLQYSTDGGQNWLQVDSDKGLGTKKATFSFKPVNLEDGNYQIIVRAIDTSGNIGLSPKSTLIIDRLPPMVGGNLVTVGAQTLTPRSDGVITSLAGVDETITMGAVGGANSIVIVATPASKEGKKQAKSFTLTQSKSTGLWTGIMSFAEEGAYVLSAQSVDGANNKTARTLNTVYVHKSPQILDAKQKKPIKDAKVTLYYLEPTSGVWTTWDGKSFGQNNSQRTNSKGEYKLFVPPGKYYLKAEAQNHRVLLSNIFEVKETSPILSSIYMKEAFSFKLGRVSIHIPPFSNDKINFDLQALDIPLPEKGVVQVGKTIPDFTLLNNEGKPVHSISFSGKPTVVSFVSSWSPNSKEQLPILSKVQANKEVNVVPIAVQEHAGLLTALSKISGNSLTFLQDPDGTTVQMFNVNSLPTHYFLDRHGVVKKVMIGTFTSDQITNELRGL